MRIIMEFLSYLVDRQWVLLVMGIAVAMFGVLCAITGEAPVRYRSWAYRNEEPRRFWRRVLGYILAGRSLIGFSFIPSLIASHIHPSPG